MKMVINLRIFYVYNINDFCCDLYDNYPYRLFKLLQDTYYTGKYDKNMAISSYDCLIDKFNKQFIHDYIFNHCRLDHYYHLKNQVHSISDGHEYSKLLVSSYSIKIKSNLSYPSFFNCLNCYGEHLFVCDFENGDYFWLKKVIKVEKKVIKQ